MNPWWLVGLLVSALCCCQHIAFHSLAIDKKLKRLRGAKENNDLFVHTWCSHGIVFLAGLPAFVVIVVPILVVIAMIAFVGTLLVLPFIMLPKDHLPSVEPITMLGTVTVFKTLCLIMFLSLGAQPPSELTARPH